MRTALALLLVLHGLIHLLGFAKAFGVARVDTIHAPVSHPFGVLWLLGAAGFATAAVLLFAAPRWWWAPSLVALVLSQTAILAAWSDAELGTLANVVVLVPTIVALLGATPSSFASVYRREVDRGLARAHPMPLVTEADLLPLPPAVRRYLRYTGAVGKSRVQSLRARFRGEMKPGPTAGWMPIHAEQYSFFDEPERIFLLDANRSGLPFEALHLYAGDAATMRVKIASLLPVIDARGPEMNRSETVTMFNDMCALAPATLLDPRIRWEELDPRTARGTFTNAGNTISAVLTFADDGSLASFSSDDRAESADGKTYAHYRWTTPLRDYRRFGDARLAEHGEAVWRHPEGDFVYARFEVLSVEYNLGAAAAR